MGVPSDGGGLDAAAAQRLAGRVYDLQAGAQGALGPALATLTGGAWTGGAAPAFLADMQRRAGQVRAALGTAVAAADGFARQTRTAEQEAAAAPLP